MQLKSVDTREDRRRSPRAELVSELLGSLAGGRAVVQVREAGAGGFSIESPVPVLVGSEHTFRFDTAGGPAIVIAICRHAMRVNLPDGGALFVAGFEYAPQPEAQVARAREIMSELS
jgi:hypothetical protein